MSNIIEFNLEGWDYGDPDALARLSTLVASRIGDHKFSDRLINAWQTGGGKAFGLLLCERIAHDTTATMQADAPRIEVPSWKSESSWNKATLEYVRLMATDAGWDSCIFRSSQPEEDWLDARAGVLGSHSVFVSGLWPKPNESYHVETVGTPYIVQRGIHGVGCVIDIGWSALMKQPVVRLAVGNPMYPDENFLNKPTAFSSATWDQESPMALFDTNGSVLIPLDAPMFSGGFGEKVVQGFRSRMNTIMAQLVPALVSTLRSIGIDFGVQIEVVIDIWQTPPCIYLVQVRPSPNTLRGFVNIPDRQGDLVTRTLKVSKAGVATGSPVVLTNIHTNERDGNAIAVGHDTPFDHLLFRLALDVKCQRDEEISVAIKTPLLNKLQTAVAQKIVIWKTMGYDCELSPDLVMAMQCLGPSGQIYWKALFPNSRHGFPGVAMYGQLEHVACANAVQRDGILASDLGEEQYARLLKRAEQDPSFIIQIISDGLVGEIRTTT